MSIFNEMAILVTAHAVYQYALRFESDAPTSQVGLIALRYDIEDEVRDALIAGRISTSKPAGIYPPNDPTCIYAWTGDEDRVYALRHDEQPPRFVVTTTMKPEGVHDES